MKFNIVIRLLGPVLTLPVVVHAQFTYRTNDGTITVTGYTGACGNHLNNWKEWIPGTVPTHAASVLRMLSPTGNLAGIIVRWESVPTRNYFLERRTNLGGQPVFAPIRSNIVGQFRTTSYTDTNAPVPARFSTVWKCSDAVLWRPREFTDSL